MKRILFAFVALMLPVVGLAVIEAGLRLVTPGRPPAMIRELGEVDGQRFMLFDRTGPASFFGPQAHHMSPADITGFFMPKPTNTLRVILTGESAMKGFPQPNAFTAASILEAMLQDDLPDRTIEVLNFSATAIASYPVRKITEAALACEPDVIVCMVGHNEYFGAYGVVATRHLGSDARWFDLDYTLRHTAIGRLLGRAMMAFRSGDRGPDKQLMELMAGVDSIPVDSPLRQRAEKNFARQVAGLAKACRDAGVPLILCVPPSNETGLHPIGPDADSGVVDGRTARGSYAAARDLLAQGRLAKAQPLFADARDRDAMPWRASSAIQQQVRDIAARFDAVLCDADAAFRSAGGDEGIGWNLMDDHVHPNIQGQAVLAGAIRSRVLEVVAPDAAAQPPARSHQGYLGLLGDNIYDRLSVDGMMHMLFQIPFLAASNPEALDFFEKRGRGYLDRIPREIRAAVENWQRTPTLSIGKKPLSGLAAMEWLKRGHAAEAVPLLRTAMRSVPPYTSWSLEYTYYWLASTRAATGNLDGEAITLAELALDRGHILVTLGDSKTGQSERFMGRILQMLGRHEEAIPLLIQAREKLTGVEREAVEKALEEARQAVARSR